MVANNKHNALNLLSEQVRETSELGLLGFDSGALTCAYRHRLRGALLQAALVTKCTASICAAIVFVAGACRTGRWRKR